MRTKSAEAKSEAQEKGAKWVGKPAGNGFEMIVEDVRAGTHSYGWRERINTAGIQKVEDTQVRQSE